MTDDCCDVFFVDVFRLPRTHADNPTSAFLTVLWYYTTVLPVLQYSTGYVLYIPYLKGMSSVETGMYSTVVPSLESIEHSEIKVMSGVKDLQSEIGSC